MPRKKIHEDRTAYKNQFIADNYDRINLVVPKGRKKEIQDHAKSVGLTLNAFINKAIANDMPAVEDSGLDL